MKRKLVETLAKTYQEKGKPLEWFEALYEKALLEKDIDLIPWADREANPNLVEWAERQAPDFFRGKKVLVVGCGLGDDAEYLQHLGGKVDAFDLSKSAIIFCKNRFPASKVNYFATDLLQWNSEIQYDLVIEIYTLQVLPEALRSIAIERLSATLAEQGRLLIICRGREAAEIPTKVPFPLTKAELNPFEQVLTLSAFEDFMDGETPPVRRFRVEYVRVR